MKECLATTPRDPLCILHSEGGSVMVDHGGIDATSGYPKIPHANLATVCVYVHQKPTK